MTEALKTAHTHMHARTHTHTHTHTHTRPFKVSMSGTTRVSLYQKGKTRSGFYWNKRQWVAVASAGAYASLHLAPDRQSRQNPTTQFFTDRMPFLPPNQQRQSTEGTCHDELCTTSTGWSVGARRRWKFTGIDGRWRAVQSWVQRVLDSCVVSGSCGSPVA